MGRRQQVSRFDGATRHAGACWRRALARAAGAAPGSSAALPCTCRRRPPAASTADGGCTQRLCGGQQVVSPALCCTLGCMSLSRWLVLCGRKHTISPCCACMCNCLPHRSPGPACTCANQLCRKCALHAIRPRRLTPRRLPAAPRYGGILLGPARFTHINNAARELLDACGYIAGKDGGGKGSSSSKGKKR